MKQLNWYQIFGQTHTIPDGRTVTPTDDIQIWLNCADIWDKTYTTLAEVLADTDTLLALINSPNAVDYMVRSTTWAVKVSVPVMTSNTTPEGECVANAVYGGSYPAWKAFDGDDSTFWIPTISTSPNYIEYDFASPVKVKKVTMKVTQSIGGGGYPDVPSYVQVWNGEEWVSISNTVNVTTSSSNIEYTVNNDNAYSKYRIYFNGAVVYGNNRNFQVNTVRFDGDDGITDNATAMSYIGLNNYCANTLLADSTWCNAICNSEYFESVLNAKVPIMTSDTEPEGQAIASSEYMPAKNAFDGNAASMWNAVNTPSNGWVGYTFVKECAVVKVTVYPFASSGLTPSRQRATTYYIQGSNDGANWTDLDSFSGTASVQEYTRIFANANKYISYRVLLAAQNYTTNEMLMATLQFYGREDV